MKLNQDTNERNYSAAMIQALTPSLSQEKEKLPIMYKDKTSEGQQGLNEVHFQTNRGGKDLIPMLDDASSDWRADIASILGKMDLSNPMVALPIAAFGLTDDARTKSFVPELPSTIFTALNEGDMERVLSVIINQGDLFASWAKGINAITEEESNALHQIITLASKAVFEGDDESAELFSLAIPSLMKILEPLASAVSRLVNTDVIGIPWVNSRYDITELFNNESALQISGDIFTSIDNWVRQDLKKVGSTINSITDWLLPDALKDVETSQTDAISQVNAEKNLQTALTKIKEAEDELGITTSTDQLMSGTDLTAEQLPAYEKLLSAKQQALDAASLLAARRANEAQTDIQKHSGTLERASIVSTLQYSLSDSEVYDQAQLREFVNFKLDESANNFKGDAARIRLIRNFLQLYPEGILKVPNVEASSICSVAFMTFMSLFETGGKWVNDILKPQKGIWQIADIQIKQLRNDKYLDTAEIIYDNSSAGWDSALRLVCAQMEFTQKMIRDKAIPPAVLNWLEENEVHSDSLIAILVRSRWIYLMGWTQIATKQETEKLLRQQFLIIKNNVIAGTLLKPSKVI